jgi:alanyl-tRNA synthetase
MEKGEGPAKIEGSARVNSIVQADGFLLARFDHTRFYPGGGGQPCDTGRITGKGFSGRVVEAYKDADTVMHKISAEQGELRPSDEVLLEIDMDRRIALMKMHTGEHILFKSLQNELSGNLMLDKISLDPEESSLFVKCDGLDWDILFRAERETNRIISEDRKIIETHVSRDDAKAMEGLRIKIDRIRAEKIRVVEVEGFDMSACTGTHSPSAGFVGSLLITKFNQAKGSYEIRFRTDVKKDMFGLAESARKLAFLLKSDPSGAAQVLESVLKERDSLKERYRDLAAKVPVELIQKELKGCTLKYQILEGLDRKRLIDISNSGLKEKTVVLLLNTDEEKASAMLTCSADLGLDVPRILTSSLAMFGGKGGGRDRFAQGSVEKKHVQGLIEEIEKNLDG